MKKLYQLISAILILLAYGQSQTAPVDNLRENPPRVWALTNCFVHTDPSTTTDKATIILRNGIISAVGTAVRVPRDATIVDLDGAHVYPGFIDSWLSIPVSDSTVSPNNNWNPLVRANKVTFDYFNPTDEELKALHQLGFTAAQLVPESGIFGGQSSLVLLCKEPQIIANPVAQVLNFQFGGWGSDDYPNSLMGCIALMRQTFLDAQWYGKSQAIFEKYPQDNEPLSEDLSLENLYRSLSQEAPFLFTTNDELYALRVIKIAREFNLNLWLKGNGYEYRRLMAITNANPFIVLPLDYPGKPEVADPYQALQYSTAQLKHWDLAPDNAARLVKAGMLIGLTSSGLKDKSAFRKNLIRSVERGLSKEDALAALTTNPAEKMRAANYLGKIQPGFLANLVIVDGDYFDEKATIRAVWISGDKIRINPAPREELAGEWSFEMPDITYSLTVEKKDTSYTGSFKYDSLTINLENLVLDDDRLSWTGQLDSLGIYCFNGHLSGDRAAGIVLDPGGRELKWTASRIKQIEEKPEEEKTPEAASDLMIVYPEGAFGFSVPPYKPKTILINDATIWTSGPKGILKDWDILFSDGKVKKIARDISLPRGGAFMIEGKGKHVTPGIIDCHSHSAAVSINEGTQSVTAEVRIEDVLNSDDIAIYRELAGGVTTINILHGSANTIGGQNGVIKLRWGQAPDDLLFKKSPPGIKFALGENVKQSNWGDDYQTRYPQTRMGVEQVLRDAFNAALDYRKAWNVYNKNSKMQKLKIPPRRDLELDALEEILEGSRLVHSHSYRQDEILMLTRVAEDFGFTVATFQHVLEGYKVADRIADHGAGASTFSDWWAYKFEVIDAIPFNGSLMSRVGVPVSFNSDSNELARRLNTEAAKAVKYGGISEENAFNFVTINPARQLQIDRWVGSLEVGKDADFVIWSENPLSTYAICEQTWIEGRRYFSLEKNRELEWRDAELRNRLIQKILAAEDRDGVPQTPAGESRPYEYSCSVGDQNNQFEEGGSR